MKLKKKQLIIVIGLSVCLASSIFCAGWLWSYTHRPLHSSLASLSTLSATHLPSKATPLAQPTSAVENLTLLPAPEEYSPPGVIPVIPNPTQSGSKTICGGPPLMFIQVAGNDRYNLADAIRIVRVDFINGRVSVLAIQRATWVTIPHLEEHGITAMIVNASHSYGVHWMGKEGGPYLLSETIALNFGIQSDRYLDISFDSFVKAVDAVGGVDVNLPNGLYDDEMKIYLNPGNHHLDGETALRFARVRYVDSDWKRIDRQTDLVMSLFKKLSNPAMLPKLPGLANQVKDDFFTDLSPLEIGQLVCLATKISPDTVKFYEIGQEMVIPTTLKDKAKSQVMLPKYELIRPYVEQFINGTLP
jgi:polyisoprenyl-teichoic acid--peptidoglycan teichoic acid transferase